MSGRKLWFALLVAAVAATTAVAQTRLDGTIEGQVVDSQGLMVPGATVTVSSPALIQTAVVTTGPDGRYRAIRLPNGIYTVAVTMDGFKTRELTGIELSVGRVLVINVGLEPGGATESVTVVAKTPVIDTQQVKNVPDHHARKSSTSCHSAAIRSWGRRSSLPVSSSARPRARAATRPTTCRRRERPGARSGFLRGRHQLGRDRGDRVHHYHEPDGELRLDRRHAQPGHAHRQQQPPRHGPVLLHQQGPVPDPAAQGELRHAQHRTARGEGVRARPLGAGRRSGGEGPALVRGQLPHVRRRADGLVRSGQHQRPAVRQLQRAVRAEVVLHQAHRPDLAQRALVRELELREG